MMNNASYEEETIIAIKRCFGSRCAEYVINKHKGGGSGKKGSRYEDLFVAYKAADVAANQVDSPTATWPFLAGQRLNFVDDAVLTSGNETEYYQLKNSLSVSWGSGEKSISDDFAKQFTLARERGDNNPFTHLIVSNEAEHTKLSQSIPDEIKSHTKVSFFPYYDNGTVNSLIVGNTEVQNKLIKIVCDDAAPLDLLDKALTLILAACNAHPNGCSVEDIIKYVHVKFPGTLRLFPVCAYESALTEDFVNTLAKIKGLWYGLPRGYFKWSAYGTSGLFPHDCFSDQFKKFQVRIVAAAPATFDDFEQQLV